jgi:ParB-like chromosome segregation protein Spo0J
MARFDRILKNETKKADQHPKRITKWIHYSKLKDNRAQYRERKTPEEKAILRQKVEALADLIEIDGEVLQDLLVRRVDTDEYEIIAGHTRRDACTLLVEERKKEKYALLPCNIKDLSDVRAEFQLYSSNGYGNKTDYQIMCELEGMKRLLETHPEEFPDIQSGRMVERLAKNKNMKKTTVGEYQTIANNLVDKAMEEFKTGMLKKSAAVELAGLPQNEQEGLLEQGATSYIEVIEYKKEKAEWFVTQYCENNISTLHEFIKICNQNERNSFKAKKIQEYIAPYGHHAKLKPEFDITFHSLVKGIEFERDGQKLHLSYIDFVKALENVYGPWQPNTAAIMHPAKDKDVQETIPPVMENTAPLVVELETSNETENVPDFGTQETREVELKSSSDEAEDKSVQETMPPVTENTAPLVVECETNNEKEDVPDFGTQEIGGAELKSASDAFPIMRNMEEREAFVLSYAEWPIWTSNPLTEETYYRYDLPDGSAIVVREYPYTSYWGEKDQKGKDLFLITEDKKYFRDAASNMTTIKEHLKNIRKGI